MPTELSNLERTRVIGDASVAFRKSVILRLCHKQDIQGEHLAGTFKFKYSWPCAVCCVDSLLNPHLVSKKACEWWHSLFNHIAYVSYGADAGAEGTKLLAEGFDVHVQGSGFSFVVYAPDTFHYLVTPKDDASVKG